MKSLTGPNLIRLQSEDNHIFRSVKILALLILLLVGFSWAQPWIGKQVESQLGWKWPLKEYSMFSDILVEPETLFVDTTRIDTAKPVDLASLARKKAYEDSLAKAQSYQGRSYLSAFFESLNQKKGKTRIAYFGDSMIEGDLVTQTLRSEFQKQYGGAGVGFVPITSPVAGFRNSIRQKFSDNWKWYTFVKDKKMACDFGISGDVFEIPKTGGEREPGWVEYKSGSGGLFYGAKLFYGQACPDSNFDSTHINRVNVEMEGTESYVLDGNSRVNVLDIPMEGAKKVKFEFDLSPAFPIYGVSFEGKEGVYLDNFGSRGSSGLNMTTLKASMLSGFNRHFNYKLIILHFGLNVLSPKAEDYSWYKSGLKRVLEHMKSQFPEASILMISVSDRSRKNEKGEFATDPHVHSIVTAQREAAMESEVAFMNLFEAMGGENSMVKWVEDGLANKDYTHVNHKGAEKISGLIHEFLIQEMEQDLNGGKEKKEKAPQGI